MPSPQDHAPRSSLLRFSLAIAFAVLFIPLAYPLLTWRVFPFGDMAGFHIPMRFLYGRALHAGDSFLWSSALGSGLYLHAEGQTGMTHPLHLLLYRALPLTAAVNLELFANFGFALAGMWMLLRRFGFRLEAAAAGALLFGFCGFNVLHFHHINLIAVVAHMPWLMWAADLILTGTTPRERAAGFGVGALAIGSQALLGFPQGVWLAGVGLAWLVAYRVFTGAPVLRVLFVVLAVALGLAIGGVQLLPTLDAVRSSFRSATTIPFRLSFSLHPLNLIQLVSPYTFKGRIYTAAWDEWFPHEFALYNGAISTLSMFWIALRWHALKRRSLAIALLALAAVALVLALGRYGFVYPLLADLPVLSGFRAPARHLVLAQFASAGLVAIVVEDLLDLNGTAIDWRRLRLLLVPAGLSIAAVTWGLAMTNTAWATAHDVRFAAAGPALIGGAFLVTTAALFAAAGRGHGYALPALMLLASVDLATWGTRYVYTERPIAIARIRPVIGLPPGAQPGDAVHPHPLLHTDMNLYLMRGLRSSKAYLGLIGSSVLDPDLPIAQRIAGVKWNWTPTGWQPVADTMPRARLVSRWQVSQDVPRDVERIDIAETALVDAPPGDTAGPNGAARMAVERPGSLVVETNAPSPQLLVLTERFHPGWRVEIDGAAAQPIRVYADYMGCRVPAGARRVTFTFAPRSFRDGLWLTIAGLLATGAIAAVIRWR